TIDPPQVPSKKTTAPKSPFRRDTIRKPNRRRNSWPMSLYNSKPENDAVSDDGNNDTLFTRVKNYMINKMNHIKGEIKMAVCDKVDAMPPCIKNTVYDKMQVLTTYIRNKLSPILRLFPLLVAVSALVLVVAYDKLQLLTTCIRNKLSPILRMVPVLVAVSTLVLALADIGTDAVSSYRICNTDCGCIYDDTTGICDAPRQGICADAVVNGTSAYHYCRPWSINQTKETCNNKMAWPLPDTCRCEWLDYDM
ncbi:unnamed protein product, partial [Meganyctiphanes norvegica]